jgi:hypothetical protein
MPTFYLMLLDFTIEGYMELKAVCRQFLWDFQAGGQAKVPLVAWNRISQPRSEGGLDLIDFRSQAQVYKLRFLSSILDMHNADWVHIACAEIQASLKKDVLRKEMKFWTVAGFFLCRPPVVHFSSRILRCLMRSWKAVLPRLELVPEDGELI